jgi:hypothetical protein
MSYIWSGAEGQQTIFSFIYECSNSGLRLRRLLMSPVAAGCCHRRHNGYAQQEDEKENSATIAPADQQKKVSPL